MTIAVDLGRKATKQRSSLILVCTVGLHCLAMPFNRQLVEIIFVLEYSHAGVDSS